MKDLNAEGGVTAVKSISVIFLEILRKLRMTKTVMRGKLRKNDTVRK